MIEQPDKSMVVQNTLEDVTKEPDKQAKRKLPHSAWKKGQSGNPKGRPKKDACITSITKEMLGKTAKLPPNAPDFMKGWTWGQLIAFNQIVAAAKPNPAILKELLDRIEGRVPQPITGGDGGPVELKVIYE